MAFWKKNYAPDTTANDIYAAFFANGGGVSGNALENSDIFTAIKLISDGVASHEKSFNTDYMNKFLHKPNSYQNGYDFWQEIVRNLMFYGNAFVYVERELSVIKELRVLEPSKVNTHVAEKNSYRTIKYSYQSETKSEFFLNSEDILHFKVNSNDGLIGVSPLSALKTEIKATANGLNSILEYFKKGIFANGILKIKEGRLTEEQKDAVKANFSDSLKNLGSSGTLLLDSTMDFETLPVDTSIFKVLDYTKYSSEQIRKVFGIPKSFFGEELTNSKDVDIHKQFHEQALQPIINQIIAEFDFKLNAQLEFAERNQKQTEISVIDSAQ